MPDILLVLNLPRYVHRLIGGLIFMFTFALRMNRQDCGLLWVNRSLLFRNFIFLECAKVLLPHDLILSMNSLVVFLLYSLNRRMAGCGFPRRQCTSL